MGAMDRELSGVVDSLTATDFLRQSFFSKLNRLMTSMT